MHGTFFSDFPRTMISRACGNPELLYCRLGQTPKPLHGETALVYVWFKYVIKLSQCHLIASVPSTSADPEGGTGDPDPPPWKITSYMGFYRELAIGPPPPPPPLENVGPPLETWKMKDFFEIDHLTSVK